MIFHKKSVSFSGEGKLWSVQYYASLTGTEVEYRVIVRYKGDSLEHIHGIAYEIESTDQTPYEIIGASILLDKNKTYDYEFNKCDGCQYKFKNTDRELKFTIYWNEYRQSESFILSRK